MGRGERPHFLKHVQFHILFTALVDADEAVSAETEIDPCLVKFGERERLVIKIIMAAGTMDDAHLSFGE